MDANSGQLKGFRNLRVWQLSIELSDRVFTIVQGYPRSETYGLVSQLSRASTSVPMNIAEGSGRNTSGEYIQALGHARGSLYEVLTLVEISLRRGYINVETADELQALCEEIGRMLTGLMKILAERKVESSPGRTPR